MSSVGGTRLTHAGWAEGRDRMQAVGAALQTAGARPTTALMAIDASGVMYWTGHPVVVLVNDPLDTVEQVARAYDIRWLVLDRDDAGAVPAATQILARGAPPGVGRPANPRAGGCRALSGLHGAGRSPVRRVCPHRDDSPVTRREAWLTAAGIFAVALVVRVVAAAAFPFPAQDAAYYVGVARNLVEGRGLVSDALWSFATPPIELPRPAFEVWLPLPTLLSAVTLRLSGATAPIPLETATRAAQVMSVVFGAILAVLTWRTAADVAIERRMPANRARTLAIGSGLTAAVYLPLVLHSTQPDSTTLFGVLVVAACLLMTRVLRDPRGARLSDLRLLGIGALLGLAGLTRNEAVWVALAWAWLAWRRADLPRAERARLVGIVATISLLVFAPWAARDWAVFGTPLPGQAAANALSVTPSDIFAWHDPPTVSRYLAAGWERLVGMRVDGVVHNLLNVLLLLGIPVSVMGLLALPWQARDRAIRPLALIAGLTFVTTSLLFPVATTWGTFLHAAAPVQVLLIVSALAGLDAIFVVLASRMGWTRPVTWVGGRHGRLRLSAVLARAAARQRQPGAR